MIFGRGRKRREAQSCEEGSSANRAPPFAPVPPASFLAALDEVTRGGKSVESFRQEAVTEVGEGVFRLPPFDPAGCAAFLASYEARYRDLESRGACPEPPNSMHDGGAACDAIGWETLFDESLQTWLKPLAAVLFPECGGESVDSVYAFVADYGVATGDQMLGFHADDAAVTLNLCLGGSFEGSQLYFRGRRCAQHRQTDWRPEEAFEYVHTPGTAILHAGAHRHGVEWLDEGRRQNLILWLRSSTEPAVGRPEPEPGSTKLICPAWCGVHAPG